MTAEDGLKAPHSPCVTMPRPDRLKFSPCVAGPKVHVIRQPLGPGPSSGKGFVTRQKPRESTKLDMNQSDIVKNKEAVEEVEKELDDEFQGVKDILVGRKHGLYVSQVEKQYKKKVGEVLKDAWWKVMEEKGLLDIEILASGVLAKWVNSI